MAQQRAGGCRFGARAASLKAAHKTRARHSVSLSLYHDREIVSMSNNAIAVSDCARSINFRMP